MKAPLTGPFSPLGSARKILLFALVSALVFGCSSARFFEAKKKVSLDAVEVTLNSLTEKSTDAAGGDVSVEADLTVTNCSAYSIDFYENGLQALIYSGRYVDAKSGKIEDPNSIQWRIPFPTNDYDFHGVFMIPDKLGPFEERHLTIVMHARKGIFALVNESLIPESDRLRPPKRVSYVFKSIRWTYEIPGAQFMPIDGHGEANVFYSDSAR